VLNRARIDTSSRVGAGTSSYAVPVYGVLVSRFKFVKSTYRNPEIPLPCRRRFRDCLDLAEVPFQLVVDCRHADDYLRLELPVCVYIIAPSLGHSDKCLYLARIVEGHSLIK
jgi:hypothetical protein